MALSVETANFKEDAETAVFFPQTLADLFAMRRQRPDAQPVAGCTWFLHNQSSRFLRLPKAVITLATIPELGRIGRGESRLDIGAAVSMGKLLSVGKNILPPVLRDTLESIATQGIRSLATLGGNICIQGRSMSTHPTLHILDARLEFRKAGGSRWVPVTRARTDGKLCMEGGEILTRIRIPLENWNVQYFRRIGSIPLSGYENVLVFSAIARTGRGVIDDLRFALGSNHLNIYRDRDMETHLVGRKLPLSRREIGDFLQKMDETLQEKQSGLSDFLRERSLAFIERLLSSLPPD